MITGSISRLPQDLSKSQAFDGSVESRGGEMKKKEGIVMWAIKMVAAANTLRESGDYQIGE